MKTNAVAMSLAIFLAPCLRSSSAPDPTQAVARVTHPRIAGEDLTTTLSCETNIVKGGASPWFVWTIQNTGQQPIYLLNHFAYASRGPVLSLNFQRLSETSAVVVAFDLRDTVNMGVQAEKIRMLKPSESFQMKARARLCPIQGPYQNIPLPPGNYRITARYDCYSPGFWIREAITSEVTRAKLWSGQIHSQAIELTITR